jgi:hypothetical protein
MRKLAKRLWLRRPWNGPYSDRATFLVTVKAETMAMKTWKIIVACDVPCYGDVTVEAETYREACKEALTKCDPQFQPKWDLASKWRVFSARRVIALET